MIGMSRSQNYLSASSDAVLLAEFDGSSLSGWSLTDGTAVVDATIGNPSPSFKATGRGMFRNLGTTFHNTTITYDFRPAAGFDGGFSFANSAGGNGSYRAGVQTKQGTSIAGQGLRFGSNGGWLYFGVGGSETLSAFQTANIWYSIKIQITADRVCTWYLNGVKQSSTVTLNSAYTSANTTNNYFGFIINGPNTVYFDNLKIYRGLV